MRSDLNPPVYNYGSLETLGTAHDNAVVWRTVTRRVIDRTVPALADYPCRPLYVSCTRGGFAILYFLGITQNI